jgi:hypothetical protein
MASTSERAMSSAPSSCAARPTVLLISPRRYDIDPQAPFHAMRTVSFSLLLLLLLSASLSFSAAFAQPLRLRLVYSTSMTSRTPAPPSDLLSDDASFDAVDAMREAQSAFSVIGALMEMLSAVSRSAPRRWLRRRRDDRPAADAALAPPIAACAAEMAEMCPAATGSPFEALFCLSAATDALGAECAAFVSTTVVGRCREDIERLCADVRPGHGRIRACLEEYAADLSESCAERLAVAKDAPPMPPMPPAPPVLPVDAAELQPQPQPQPQVDPIMVDPAQVEVPLPQPQLQQQQQQQQQQQDSVSVSVPKAPLVWAGFAACAVLALLAAVALVAIVARRRRRAAVVEESLRIMLQSQ